MSHYIETRSGKLFDYNNPSPSAVCLDDVAWALARTCRFRSQTHLFYSVAEHSCMMAERLYKRTNDPVLAYYALMHDAAEAYYGDLPTPLKKFMGGVWEDFKMAVDGAIEEAFKLNMHDNARWPVVHQADQDALFWEAYHLLPSKGESLRGKHSNFSTRHLDENWGIPACVTVDEAYDWFMGDFEAYGSRL